MKIRPIRTTKKKKGWKYILYVILFLILIYLGIYIYINPHNEVRHYVIDRTITDKIESIEVECRRFPLLFVRKMFKCGDYTSFYENGNKSYHSYYNGKNEEYTAYYENGQKKAECNFEESPFVVNGNQLNRYQHSVEPCIFYNENGNIQKSYGEGKIEKSFVYSMENLSKYRSGQELQTNRLEYYTEEGHIEKIEYYRINFPFTHLYQRDVPTSEGMKKEYYLFNGDLGQIEFYDKKGKLISTRVYETIEYDHFNDRYLSKTFYTEDGKIEKIELYDNNGKLERVEEYGNE